MRQALKNAAARQKTRPGRPLRAVGPADAANTTAQRPKELEMLKSPLDEWSDDELEKSARFQELDGGPGVR
jgi:hypothetical protein